MKIHDSISIRIKLRSAVFDFIALLSQFCELLNEFV